MTHEAYIDSLKTELSLIDTDKLRSASNALFNCCVNGSGVWIAGNGGNSANALHFATDWSKGLYLSTGKPMKVQALTGNSALFSAIVNDLDNVEIFSFQLKMNAKKGDVAVLLSAGGGSTNVLRAADACREMGVTSIGLIGGEAASLHGLFDIELHTSNNDIQIVEDIHAVFGHLVLREIVERSEKSKDRS
jgi:D-sedoheptulose 7-phosphate isomerase